VRVLPGSSAAKAGLLGVDLQTGEVGDIITAVNGKPVNTVADLSSALEQAGIGHTVTMAVERDGQSREVKVEVQDISGEGGAP
jgi:2-alkenal reductase